MLDIAEVTARILRQRRKMRFNGRGTATKSAALSGVYSFRTLSPKFPGAVHLDAVIDDQIGQHKRIHGRGIDQGRHSGEILEDHPRRHEGHGRRADRAGAPGGQVVDVLVALAKPCG